VEQVKARASRDNDTRGAKRGTTATDQYRPRRTLEQHLVRANSQFCKRVRHQGRMVKVLAGKDPASRPRARTEETGRAGDHIGDR
jgi:hypothetical protein